MSGDHDNLLGVLGSLPVGDDVEALCVGEGLRSQGQMQLHDTLAGEVLKHVSVFSGDGGSGDLGYAGRISP